MKKKVLTLALIAICLSITAYGTLAYFTADATARNVITAGAVDIAIEEWQQVGDELLPYPDEPIAVMPGARVSKIAQVKNLENEAWIRARCTITLKDADGNPMTLPGDELQNILHLVMNENDWITTDPADGWFYHVQSVPTGETTAALFTGVTFDGPNMGNEYQNCTLEIDVVAQAVQTANNGETVLEAAGWPEA